MLKRIPLFVVAALGALAVPSFAVAQVIDDGYLDYFDLTDGRRVDTGQQGGGVGPTREHKIFVARQGIGPGLPVDGRLTGTVHGKLRVVQLSDRNGDLKIDGNDLDDKYDVSWQLIGHSKVPNSSAFIAQTLPMGLEGTPSPGTVGTVNHPPGFTGTASTWKLASCDAMGNNPGSTGTGTPGAICDGGGLTFVPAPTGTERYTGFVDYTFPVSIPGQNDYTPAPNVSGVLNWVLAATVGETDSATPAGAVGFGMAANYDPAVASSLAQGTQFGTVAKLASGSANVGSFGVLTTVEIVVTPEPGTLALLTLGVLPLIRRRQTR